MTYSGEIYQELWKTYVENYGAHNERLRAEWSQMQRQGVFTQVVDRKNLEEILINHLNDLPHQVTLRMAQVCAAQADAILESVASVIASRLEGDQ
jgi:hypothetical protein